MMVQSCAVVGGTATVVQSVSVRRNEIADYYRMMRRVIGATAAAEDVNDRYISGRVAAIDGPGAETWIIYLYNGALET